MLVISVEQVEAILVHSTGKAVCWPGLAGCQVAEAIPSQAHLFKRAVLATRLPKLCAMIAAAESNTGYDLAGSLD